MTGEDLTIKKDRIKELKRFIDETKKEYDYNKAMQLALKLVINGTYGAFANRHFVCSNADIANAITAHGRDVIQFMLNKIEHYFYYEWHNDTEAHALLGLEFVGVKDNMFCFYDRNLNQIGYPKSTLVELLEVRDLSISEIKKINNIENDKGIDIQYEYFIHDFSKVNSLDQNPNFTQKGQPDYEGFTAYKGTNPVTIYGDTDSLYISYSPIINSVGFEGDGLKFILHMDNVLIKKMFNKFLDEYATPYKVKSLHDFELETISKSALFIEKKNYLNNIVWEDGVHHENLSYFYPKGIEIVRSSTPEFVRENVYEVINYIFGNPNNINQRTLRDLLKKLKKDFEWKSYENIDSISMTTSCSNYNEKVFDDVQSVVVESGTHFGVKAAAFHNYLLNRNSEYKTKYDMVKSGRIKYFHCKHNKGDNFGNYFGYLRSFYPKEVVEKEGVEIDIDTQFDKTFLSIINRFMNPLGFPPFTKELGFFSSIFDF